MSKLALKKGSTSQSLYFFVQDSSKTTGEGLTGLTYSSSGLVCYYIRPLGSATQVSLVTQTATGAYSSGGFVEVSSANMPGVYRLDIPNAALASGVPSMVIMLKGATNMAPVLIEIQLTDFDLNSTSNAVGAAASVTAGVTVSTNNDKTGYALTSAYDAAKTAASSVDLTSVRAAKLDNLDAAVTTRLAASDYAVPPTAAAVRSEMDSNSNKLANLDAAVSTRLATSGYTTPPTVSDIATAVWEATTRTLSTFGTLISDIWAYATRTLSAFGFQVATASDSNVTAIKAKTDNLPASPAAVGSAMTLTADERAAVATKVEAQIIDETDSNRVLQAIVDKIAAVNPSLDDLTLGAIASSVRTELTTELARLDAAVSTRLATSGYAAPDNSGISAIKSKTDLIPAAPAAVGSQMTLTSDYNAAKTASSASAVAAIPTDPLRATDSRLPATVIAAKADIQSSDTSALTTLINDMPEAVWKYGGGRTITGQTALVTVISPVLTASNIRLVAGDDYYAADARMLEWASTAWQDLTGAVVKFVCNGLEADVLVITPGEATQTLRLELSGEETARIPGKYRFSIVAKLADGHQVTLIEGECSCM